MVDPVADPVLAPMHMVWLATNACNARCSHCSSNSARRTPDELTTTEAARLFEDLADFGVLDLAVSGGEPLLRPDLLDLLQYARTLGFSTGVGSNGGKLNHRQASALAAAGLGRLQISLDGFRDAHDQLRRWPGLFDRVLHSITIAMDAGLRVHLCCTISSLNAHRLEEFVEFVAGLGVHRLNVSRYVPTGRGTDALDLGAGAWADVIRRCASLRADYAGLLDIVTHLAQQILVDPEVACMPGFRGCQAGAGQGCITANGQVLPCVLLPIPVGNVRQMPFHEIWTGAPLLNRLRYREVLRGACGSCDLRSRCGGCRAVAYARTGDPFAPDHRCWLPGSAGRSNTQGREVDRDQAGSRQSHKGGGQLLPIHP